MRAIVMAGGRGTRFWPASRRDCPKQFIRWGGEPSLFRQTLDRLEPIIPTEAVAVVCPEEYRLHVEAAAPELAASQLIIEPLARNTAACLGLAAWHLERETPAALMVVLPADHLIADVDAFQQAVGAAAQAAADGWLVTFGLKPSFPATGYGYLERGRSLESDLGDLAEVARFIEKPALERAVEFASSGRHFWNSGMFVWRSDVFLAAVDEHLPELSAALNALDWRSAPADEQLEVFSRLESISVDYGIMERAAQVAVVACELGWSDVGSWDAVADLGLTEQAAGEGPRRLVTIDSRNCLVDVPDGKLAALVGVKDLIVVDTGDALLICRRGQSQSLRQVMQQLEEAGWDDVL